MKPLPGRTLPTPEIPLNVLDPRFPLTDYCEIDLSTANSSLNGVNLTDPVECQAYIDGILKENQASVAYDAARLRGRDGLGVELERFVVVLLFSPVAQASA